MSLFHRHAWEEIERTFTPPRSGKWQMDDISHPASQMVLHGFTNVELRCRECGKIRVHKFLGKVGVK